jgi:HEAT repeat protein
MADATSKKLWQLLELGNSPAVRCAALVVVGEIGDRDPKLEATLSSALGDPDPSVRAQAIATVGQLQIHQALPTLLARVREGGDESVAAAQAAARLGAKATHALQELMGSVAPGLRRRIASALATGDTASAETAAVDVLLDSDPNVVDAASRSLLGRIPSLERNHRRRLADHAIEVLARKKGPPLSATSQAAVLRLLAALEDPRGEQVYWSLLERPSSPELRAAALQALGNFPAPAAREKVRRLVTCATDADFRVAAPALMILKGTAPKGGALPDWLPLFDAPDAAGRRFAIEKLADRDRPEIAQALLQQLDHPDGALRDEALKALARLKHGPQTLVRALVEAESVDRSWALARVQAPLVREYRPELRKTLFAQACDYLEKDDRRADAFLFLLREADPRGLRDQLADRATALRKKKKYAVALAYLRLLARDPACGEPIRQELAACGLKVSEKDLAADARASDPSLHQFAALQHRHAVDPIDFVSEARWLDAEDLFYLGFHFAEGTGTDKDFGGQILNLLLKRFPRSKLAKDAKNKLKRQGVK